PELKHEKVTSFAFKVASDAFRFVLPNPKSPTFRTRPRVISVDDVVSAAVAALPKPTFYRLPCGSHADNFT
ncbi:hypothetical protein, partial [Enterobacter hormaechei]|uniref:hypothetical protein n=1 Tax=Enterobacter hormaechei TaxID=158836 RepID=UPI003D6F0AB3